jgi:origin recognition complex subunit 2
VNLISFFLRNFKHKFILKGIGFSKLYYECREKFYVSNELTLRAQLTEFIDHKLIKLKTESDGSEMIYILVDDVNLKLFLDELRDKV